MIEIWAPDGVGEVAAGDDLAQLLLPLVELADGDVVLVTSKVVSKAEGRVRRGERADAVAEETRRVVARRGSLVVVANRLGLTMAAAGVDASNVTSGHVVLLPEDPDASARQLRAALAERAGVNVAVVVTDTAGRAWREGQTDLAIGVAGLLPLDDHAGRADPYGNELAVTAPAVADELAGAAELAAGKLSARPFAVVRGRADLVLPPGEDGPGAGALLRDPSSDLFALGAREAVTAALHGQATDQEWFGAPAAPDDLAEAMATVAGVRPTRDDAALVVSGLDEAGRWAVATLAYAHGWTVAADADGAGRERIRLLPGTP